MSFDKVYNAPPTLAKFHASDARMRFVRGPVGSGKSVAMVMEMLRRATEIPAQEDGVRRSRAIIVRNTLSQIKSTCLVTWMEWLRPISHYKVSDQTIQLRLDLEDGTRVESDVFLLPLDTPENINRLLSLELSWAWLSEAREIPLDIAQAVLSRTGRYPSRANVSEYWHGVFMESNSFSIDSEWYGYLELEPPSNLDYFVQPGARDQGAENLEHLPVDYYPSMIEANSASWVASYVDNKLMPSLSGQAVWAQSFDSDYHVADTELRPIYNKPVTIGMDVGRNPAATIGQIDLYGRLLVLHSVWAENMGIEKFLDEVLKPVLYDRFANQAMFAVLDPAAKQRSQIGEKSVLDVVRESGLNAVLASTNEIAPRLRAVESYMNRRNGLLICPVHCQDLIRAVRYGYRFKRSKNTNVLEEIPDKVHPDSDLGDSLQYLALGVESRTMAFHIRRSAAMHAPARPEPNHLAW